MLTKYVHLYAMSGIEVTGHLVSVVIKDAQFPFVLIPTVVALGVYQKASVVGNVFVLFNPPNPPKVLLSISINRTYTLLNLTG